MRISDWSSDVCSSDLRGRAQPEAEPGHAAPRHRGLDGAFHRHPDRTLRRQPAGLAGPGAGGGDEYHRRPGRLGPGCPENPCKSRLPGRSEEHTSELQSLMRISYAVFCLKKKTNTNEDANIRKE